jgi:hypothetical protein
MSLDGLRAWIGEVERKLGARTRVFLVLLAIAIGASGAAIYLALHAEDENNGASGAASVGEVQALREQVEQGGATSPQVSTLEAQVVELRTEIEALKAKSQGGGKGAGTGGGTGTGGGASGGEPIPEIEAKPIPESGAEK